MSEYPKVIDVGGIKVTAFDADDEARWRKKPANPLNDVVIEMDNPAYDETPKANYDIQTDEVTTPEPVSDPEPKKKKAPKKK